MSKKIDFGQRVIKIIRDVDFKAIDNYDLSDSDDITIGFQPKHGTVIYIAGLCEGDEDDLLCMGAEDGTMEFQVAFYPDFLEFNKGWLRLIGRAKDADKIEALEKERDRKCSSSP